MLSLPRCLIRRVLQKNAALILIRVDPDSQKPGLTARIRTAGEKLPHNFMRHRNTFLRAIKTLGGFIFEQIFGFSSHIIHTRIHG